MLIPRGLLLLLMEMSWMPTLREYVVSNAASLLRNPRMEMKAFGALVPLSVNPPVVARIRKFLRSGSARGAGRVRHPVTWVVQRAGGTRQPGGTEPADDLGRVDAVVLIKLIAVIARWRLKLPVLTIWAWAATSTKKSIASGSPASARATP